MYAKLDCLKLPGATATTVILQSTSCPLVSHALMITLTYGQELEGSLLDVDRGPKDIEVQKKSIFDERSSE